MKREKEMEKMMKVKLMVLIILMLSPFAVMKPADSSANSKQAKNLLSQAHKAIDPEVTNFVQVKNFPHKGVIKKANRIFNNDTLNPDKADECIEGIELTTESYKVIYFPESATADFDGQKVPIFYVVIELDRETLKLKNDPMSYKYAIGEDVFMKSKKLKKIAKIASKKLPDSDNTFYKYNISGVKYNNNVLVVTGKYKEREYEQYPPVAGRHFFLLNRDSNDVKNFHPQKYLPDFRKPSYMSYNNKVERLAPKDIHYETLIRANKTIQIEGYRLKCLEILFAIGKKESVEVFYALKSSLKGNNIPASLFKITLSKNNGSYDYVGNIGDKLYMNSNKYLELLSKAYKYMENRGSDSKEKIDPDNRMPIGVYKSLYPENLYVLVFKTFYKNKDDSSVDVSNDQTYIFYDPEEEKFLDAGRMSPYATGPAGRVGGIAGSDYLEKCDELRTGDYDKMMDKLKSDKFFNSSEKDN